MAKIVEKNSFFGDKKIIYFEKEKIGEYSLIEGEWIWIKGEY